MSTKEMNRVLGHADESDGIEEYDNPLPNWWVGLFYATIIWAAVYGTYYHFIGKKSYAKDLAAQMAEAEKRWPHTNELANVELTPANIAAGEAIFQTNCVGCHGADLHGGIGPNLVDTTWIHGSSPDSIVSVITHGVSAKGMPTWGPILGSEKIGQVAAYVISKGQAAQ
ncbi:MAG: cbb3-type cytochrome c oxidase N-terminal domain-containing protein [Gemmatimonadota bacterium]